MTQRSFAYGVTLPFAIHCSLRPFRGAEGNSRISLAGHLDSESAQALSTALVRFSALASTGALCGADIAPWSSGAALSEPKLAEGTLTGELRVCNLDDAALTVLCDLIVGTGTAGAVERLVVTSDGPADAIPIQRVDRHQYPLVYRQLPFEFLDEEPEGGGFLVRVEFAGSVPADVESRIRQLAAVLDASLRAGVFCIPPAGPIGNYLEPEEPIVFGNTLEWPIGKFRADPMAFVALANGLAAMGPRARIVRLCLTQ